MSWETRFERLGAIARDQVAADESFTLWLEAEDSDFVRFNHGLVRQAGTVHDGALTVRWIRGRRHASAQVTLTSDPSADQARLLAEIDALRTVLAHVPDDPHLTRPDAVVSTEDDDGGAIPDAGAVTADVTALAKELGVDLVGIYAGGASHRGYLDSRGQRNWFTSHGHVFDWSLVLDRDKAVKQGLAGRTWDVDAFRAELERGRQDLAALARPSRKLEPGLWRAFLAPGALHEILDTVSWNGFSAREQHRRQSCLGRLAAGERALDPRVTIVDDLAGGLSPRFTDDGYVRPDTVPLVVEGRHAGALVGPRSAAELSLACNGADDAELPVALAMRGGDLPSAEARQALGTGVWISQLWYANFSDRPSGRLTGMTRFATLWIEDGEVAGPVDVMRFDDTVYDLLGDRLEALTAETTLMPSTSTYGFRSTRSMRLPGALVGGIRFTL